MTADELSRLVKLLIDSGKANSPEHAEALLSGLSACILVQDELLNLPHVQVALLTLVNCGSRTLLGGIAIDADLEVALNVEWHQGGTLSDAVREFGLVERIDNPTFYIGIGDVEFPKSATGIRLVLDGSIGGVTPPQIPAEVSATTFAPSAVFAAALAISQVFQRFMGLATACRLVLRVDLLSLNYQPDHAKAIPALRIPHGLWLIGLGHLGQAYSWTASFMNYADNERPVVVLQDYDGARQANLATSVLTMPRHVQGNDKKARLCAEFLERRGFNTVICEREFDGNTRRGQRDPLIALGGLDSPFPRQALENAGFQLIIDAGLGVGPNDYSAFEIHTFPGSRPAAQLFSRSDERHAQTERLIHMEAYQALKKAGVDECGLFDFAGKAVGTSFVGLAVSAMVMSELTKRLCGWRFCDTIAGDLRSADRIRTVINSRPQPFI